MKYKLKLNRFSVILYSIAGLLSFLYLYYFFAPDSRLLYLKISIRDSLGLYADSSYSDIRFIQYTVKEGDNYWNMANRFGLNMDTIVSLAPKKVSKNIHNIPVGLSLELPVIDGIKYIKKSNETISFIASNYDIPVVDVLKIRDIISNSNEIYFLKGASFTLSERLDKLGTLFLNPLSGSKFRITALFGFRIHPISHVRKFHKGIDLAAPRGTPIYAAMGGTVTYAGVASGYGNLIVILHKKGYSTKYGHLSKILVKSGTKVVRQQRIGSVGSTGISTGNHLHFEVLRRRKNIDPRGVTDLH